MRWTVLSRRKDEDGETTTWLVDFGNPKEPERARDDDEVDDDDTARTDERRD